MNREKGRGDRGCLSPSTCAKTRGRFEFERIQVEVRSESIIRLRNTVDVTTAIYTKNSARVRFGIVQKCKDNMDEEAVANENDRRTKGEVRESR